MTTTRTILATLGGGLLILLAGACAKEFSCPLSAEQGVCASVSQVYANDPKAQPKPKPCDPFTEDCAGNKQTLASLNQGQRNQFPILPNCNPYTQPCLAGTTPVATAATDNVAQTAAPVKTVPPGPPPKTLFPPLPHPGTMPVPPPIAGAQDASAPHGSAPGSQGTVRMGEPPFQAPVRIGERILRMWVPDWQDADGDLHAASYHYVQVAPSSWWPAETPPPQMLRPDRTAYPTPPRRLNNEQRQALQTGSQTVVTNAPTPTIPNPFPAGTLPQIAPPNQSATNPFGTR
jgi:hypothetical protein